MRPALILKFTEFCGIKIPHNEPQPANIMHIKHECEL